MSGTPSLSTACSTSAPDTGHKPQKTRTGRFYTLQQGSGSTSMQVGDAITATPFSFRTRSEGAALTQCKQAPGHSMRMCLHAACRCLMQVSCLDSCIYACMLPIAASCKQAARSHASLLACCLRLTILGHQAHNMRQPEAVVAACMLAQLGVWVDDLQATFQVICAYDGLLQCVVQTCVIGCTQNCTRVVVSCVVWHPGRVFLASAVAGRACVCVDVN